MTEDGKSIGTPFIEDEPITKGWTGLINKLRKIFGQPVITRRVWGIRFDPGLVIPPGEKIALSLSMKLSEEGEDD